MKKFIIIVSIVATSITATAQTKNNASAGNSTVIATHLQVFNNALQVQDMATALQACHYIVALQGSNSPYKDTLAILYYNIGSYKQALIIGLEQLNAKPSNASLLGIVADGYNKMGNTKQAITYQEKLYAQQSTAANGFGLMEMQMGLQRYAEVLATANVVLNSKIDSNLVYYYKDTTGATQQTPLKAAIYNMVGMCLFKQGNKEKAALMFTQALQIDDKFIIARLNAEAVKK